MQVETFEQNEVVGGKIEDENSPEAFELIESLGLTGQRQMMGKKEEGVSVRCPYRAMTIRERRVYEAVFPKHVKLKEYQDSMIPLRILQVAAHANELDVYERLEVWCENSQPKDPILVGIVKKGESSEVMHILARWGDALESFSVTVDRAKAMLTEKYRTEATKKKLEMEQILSTIDGFVEEHLNGGWVYI